MRASPVGVINAFFERKLLLFLSFRKREKKQQPEAVL
jgi:hypothetical protein